MEEDDEDMISVDDFEREEMIQEKMNQKALKKAMDKGIRFVLAFEG
jgi:hypothetical protein